MKIFHTQKILSGIVAIIFTLGILGVVSAGRYVPSTSSQQNPVGFLDVSGNAQAKQGWLALGGASSNPLATLDVQGVSITDTLKVLGNGWSTGMIRVGGTSIPVAGDPKLVVDGARLRASSLVGTGDRPVCADATGLFKICATNPGAGTCGSASGSIFTAAPTTNLCTNGTASTVTGTGPWSWTCAGTNGGADASCNAQKVFQPNPLTPINGACGNPISCNAGTLANVSTTYVTPPANATGTYIRATTNTWTCNGFLGGTNDTCSSGFYCPPDYEISGCFLPGTAITLADGTSKNIEKISAGDVVQASDEKTNNVEKLITHNYKGWVYGINGSKPFITGMHPVMTTEGWKSFEPEKTFIAEPDVKLAGALKVGDILLKENGAQEKLTSFTREWMNTTVYNLSTSGSHEYYADKYQVHNKSTNPYCVPIPPPPTPIPFCTSHNGNSPGCHWTYQGGVNNPNSHGIISAFVCENIPSNSLKNLDNSQLNVSTSQLTAWGWDPSNAPYLVGGTDYSLSLPTGATKPVPFVNMTCWTSIP